MHIKFIQKIIDKIRRKNNIQKSKNKYKSLIKGKSTIFLDNFEIKGDFKDKVKIGNDSMLNCNIIFESNKGYVEIGNRCFINAGTNIISHNKIIFGNDVTVAWGCTFYDHNAHSLDWNERVNDIKIQIENFKKTGNSNSTKNKNWDVVKSSPIIICDKAWIGMNCTILNGVTVGEGAIVGACSVVRENVEPWTVVAGNPAKVIRKLNHD